jgi:hypothetical protein
LTKDFSEPQDMVLIKVFPALTGAVLLMLGGAPMAADYRADEFLGLDLSKAVLSPKRLGPPAEFALVPLEAKGDIAKKDAAKTDTIKADTAKADTAKSYDTKTDAPKSDIATTQPAQPGPEHKAVSHRGSAVAHARIEKPRGAARTKLAHRQGNPLDAQARDTRIQSPRVQTWPCNSGGICNWKQ